MRTVAGVSFYLYSGVLEAGRHCCLQIIKHHFDMSALSGLLPSLFAYKGLEVTVLI